MPPAVDDERLQRVLGGDALGALRARLRAAFERVPAGAQPAPFRLAGLAPHEREALAAIVGLPPRDAASIAIDPAAVGARLAAAGIAPDLRAALERLDGPVRAVVDERERLAARWTAALAAVDDERLRAWLAAPLARGLLKRAARGDADEARALLAGASAVLAALPAPGTPRARLAAATLGDAHALDDGRPLSTLVLAVLRHHRGGASDDEETRRALWAAAGVSVNELARPALVLNLAAADGEPAWWSLRRLLRAPPPAWPVAGREVFVCENPNLVAIAADALGARCAPLVCTDGMPAAAQRALLFGLVAAGARLRYHGDFDWPGIAIANVVLRDFGASPWRMRAEDYEAGLAAQRPGAVAPLDGNPVVPSWCDALGAAMRERGRALPEEAVAEALRDDLAPRDASFSAAPA